MGQKSNKKLVQQLHQLAFYFDMNAKFFSRNTVEKAISSAEPEVVKQRISAFNSNMKIFEKLFFGLSFDDQKHFFYYAYIIGEFSNNKKLQWCCDNNKLWVLAARFERYHSKNTGTQEFANIINDFVKLFQSSSKQEQYSLAHIATRMSSYSGWLKGWCSQNKAICHILSSQAHGQSRTFSLLAENIKTKKQLDELLKHLMTTRSVTSTVTYQQAIMALGELMPELNTCINDTYSHLLKSESGNAANTKNSYLPYEIWQYIFRYLDTQSLLNLRCASPFFYKLIDPDFVCCISSISRITNYKDLYDHLNSLLTIAKREGVILGVKSRKAAETIAKGVCETLSGFLYRAYNSDRYHAIEKVIDNIIIVIGIIIMISTMLALLIVEFTLSTTASMDFIDLLLIATPIGVVVFLLFSLILHAIAKYKFGMPFFYARRLMRKHNNTRFSLNKIELLHDQLIDILRYPTVKKIEKLITDITDGTLLEPRYPLRFHPV